MGNSASKNKAPRASLLGLPTELRLMIYDIIKDSEIHHHLPSWRRYRSLSSPIPRLPLCDLARSCKLLAQEIRDHSQSLPATERYVTIHIQVDADEHKHDYSLAHVIRPAKDLTALRIVFSTSVSHLYWADDFPNSMISHGDCCIPTSFTISLPRLTCRSSAT
jgi:hypothetical protein